MPAETRNKPRSTGLAWATQGPAAEERPSLAGALPGSLPPDVELRHADYVFDQGEVPCCVSCAVVTAMEILYAQRGESVRLSPLFNYYLSRPFAGDLDDLMIAEALYNAKNHGVAPLDMHDYAFTADNARRGPTDEARLAAKRHRLRSKRRYGGRVTRSPYHRVQLKSVEAWKRRLAGGSPLILGFGLGESAARLERGEDVLLEIDFVENGHAVVVMGYDDEHLDGSGAFRIKDSRGPTVGKDGMWWLPYFLVETGVARELWVVTTIS